MKKFLAVFAILALLLLLPAGTAAQEPPPPGCEGGACEEGVMGQGESEALGLTGYQRFVVRGGYVAAGVGMRNRGYGTIKLTGIPRGAKVYKAYLYWNIVDYYQKARHQRGVFAGHRIRGTYIGGDHEPCWLPNSASSFSYRADVTRYVKGNGKYILKGFASKRTDGADPWLTTSKPPLMEGASLVVIFKKATYPNTTIVIWDGAAETPQTAATRWITIGGFTGKNLNVAYTTFIGADGQSSSEPASTFNGNAVAAADWDGTDPQSGANFSQGNLWDTDTASVGAFIDPGDTSATIAVSGSPDCLVWVAQVFSISDGTLDTDGDALKDGWEANGYDYNGDGQVDVDLPAMGANPWHKDIFVEHDWMDGIHNHMPNSTVLNNVRKAFKKAPVSNPDGRTGINLHNDVSNSFTHVEELAADCSNLWAAFDTVKNANFQTARRDTHHYVLWVHDLCPGYGSTSGISRGIPASDFIISLGSWPGYGDTNARSGTFMHELGHNLGLTHGGNAGDHENYKPNHVSVMNYSFQVIGVPRNSPNRRVWDYTRMTIYALNEKNLNEAVGLNGSASLAKYGTRYYCQGTNATRDDWTADTNVDWNCKGGIQASVASDINKSGSRTTLGQVRNQWINLTYNGGTIGGVATLAGVSAAEFAEHPCLSWKEYERSLPGAIQ